MKYDLFEHSEDDRFLHRQREEYNPSRSRPSSAMSHRSLYDFVPHRLGSILERVGILPASEKYNQIEVDVAYSGIWEETITFPERRPRAFNVMVATAKTWLADLVVQFGEMRRSRSRSQRHLDFKRSAAFALFGFIYNGLVQWFLYVSVFTQLCPTAIRFANEPISEKMLDRAGQGDLLLQLLLDNLVVTVFLYFPIFYTVKSMVQDSSYSLATLQKALGKYRQNFVQDNITACSVWIPLDLVVFCVPMYMRLPLGHSFSFGWTMIVSYMRGTDGEAAVAKPGAKPEARSAAL